MPFLSDVTARHGPETTGRPAPLEFPTSPFVECILAASLCGRIVAHKQRSVAEQCYAETSQEFRRRHHVLDSLLGERIKGLRAHCGQDFALLTDPSLIFAALVIHMNVLILGEIVESMPLKAEASHPLHTKQKRESAMAAEQMTELAAAVAHMDRFQGHFFTSIPLLTAARFYMLHSAPDGECSSQLQTICGVLQDITGINNPARYFQLPTASLGGI
ncbi:uncharacterized protein PG998_011963 [Apiospora kogelbergensis]|uniref:uncharacterized protein n=1 Tax=Apiospora kogelbergensis TaxID=1337665 RepID=UPI003131362D